MLLVSVAACLCALLAGTYLIAHFTTAWANIVSVPVAALVLLVVLYGSGRRLPPPERRLSGIRAAELADSAAEATATSPNPSPSPSTPW